jgi:hypothetical protein
MVIALAVPGITQERPAGNMQIVLEKIRADKKLLVPQPLIEISCPGGVAHDGAIFER